jgi:hypothetical protein
MPACSRVNYVDNLVVMDPQTRHLQQWTGVGVVTVRRSRNRGSIPGRGSAASGQDLGPPAYCLLGVKWCFLLGKSGSEGDYFRQSDSEIEGTVPPRHHTLSLCVA